MEWYKIIGLRGNYEYNEKSSQRDNATENDT